MDSCVGSLELLFFERVPVFSAGIIVWLNGFLCFFPLELWLSEWIIVFVRCKYCFLNGFLRLLFPLE